MNIIDNTERQKLSEGRSQGMGFAFAKREGDTLTLVQPISPCKDYLNDVIFCEHTGKSISAYGLKCEKQDIFKTEAYLVFAMCPSKWDTKYNENQLPVEIKNLNKNYQVVEGIINNLEEKFKLKTFSKFVKIKDNLYISQVPLFWIQSTYLISLYSLLIRAFIYEDKGGDIFDLESKLKYSQDAMLVKEAISMIKDIVENGVKTQDFEHEFYKTHTNIHNQGLMKYLKSFK